MHVANPHPRRAQPVVALSAPDRPALATNVVLIGELRESGFADPQWLVRRDGQFIQVTELLYRIAELADGTRAVEDIAAAVTDATEWLVTPDHVRYLVEAKLIPLGVIAAAEAGVRPRAERRMRSPLAINLRGRLLGPRAIEPIARPLSILHVPPVLATMLVVVVLAHEWLYVVHGIGEGVRALLLNPVLLLPVLAILPLAALFHEFGHASALRYGGGEVRGMGVGFYLIYPAFYTDVTDVYRLGRWARVRTDLGGLYFSLVFTLVLIALYWLTGREFLLLVVLVIDLDVLYQLLPFVRLDGYWAFADLTGIPDPFSQMGPFIRSALPRRLSAGPRLPQLRHWVKVAFIIYVVSTIPVLALLFFLAVTRLPQAFFIELHALLRQAAAAAAAQARGDVGSLAASVAFMLVLVLLMIGIVYLFYSVIRAPLSMLWRRGKRLSGHVP